MTVVIIGGGPAGLMAAEAVAPSGRRVLLFDAMPSVGRKFLMAGKSGLNLTNAEPFERLLSRFGNPADRLRPVLGRFDADTLRAWAKDLGIDTFIGSSGHVFPTDMKAAPLLRAWLRRLREAGVRFHMRHRWIGWSEDGALRFATPTGDIDVAADAVILALGGASWPQLGSDGAWVALLRRRGVAVAPLRPANCGFDVGWSLHFRSRFVGHPVKTVALTVAGERRRGEFVITETGVEGGAIYAHAAALRERIERDGAAELLLDLAPDRDAAWLAHELGRPRGSRSMAEHLRRRGAIDGVKAGLLRECLPAENFATMDALAAAIKALPLRLRAPRPIAEAISSAGGVTLASVDDAWMIRALPGIFCAGEMLDWEVPTGGYLLTACLALGRAAGLGAVAWLANSEPGGG